MLGMVLDVAIGLIFIYLLLGLVCSVANELIAGVLNSRAKNLETGLRNLLSGTGKSEIERRFYEDPFIRTLNKPLKKPFLIPESLYRKEKLKSFTDKLSHPSYIPPQIFVIALLNAVAGDPEKSRDIVHLKESIRTLDERHPLRGILLTLIKDSEHEIHRFKANVEAWFNNSMDRVSAWYKKKSQLAILLLAVGTTILFNADSIEITRALSLSPEARQAIVALAVQEARREDPDASLPPDRNLAELSETLRGLGGVGLPIGWQSLPGTPKAWSEKILGLLLTSLAVSLGAPFWFDLLKRVVNLRSTGASPEDSAPVRRRGADRADI